VAAADGYVAESGGGFALLERPIVDPPPRPVGTVALRVARRVDRHWEWLVFALPPLACLLASVATALAGASLIVPLLAVLAGMIWIAGLLTTMLASQFGWLARMGSAPTRRRSRVAESLRGTEWHVPLLHQPNPERVNGLLAATERRLGELLTAQAQDRVRHRARVGAVPAAGIVLLTDGITTQDAEDAVVTSPRLDGSGSRDGAALVLVSTARPLWPEERQFSRGGFLLLYLSAIGLVIAVMAGYVADQESEACGSQCAGRPTTYALALRWLLQRLLLSDPPGLAPATTYATILGWLVSLAALMALPVLVVAVQAEIKWNKQIHQDHLKRGKRMAERSRTLVLVVTEAEQTAVLDAARRHSDVEPTTDHSAPRSVHLLGEIGGSQVYLCRAGEAGIAGAAGMFATAGHLIRHLAPDYIVLTGICFGLRPDQQQMGDIVIANAVQNIDPRKITDGGDMYRGHREGTSAPLHSRFLAESVTWRGAPGSDVTPRVHNGVVLCSNAVVNSAETVAELRRAFPDAIAGEMEGSGVSEAADEDVKPDWIVVKAICDWGFDKGDDHHREAANNAADYVMHVVASHALEFSPRRLMTRCPLLR
jgi:nucleoside phosphorylase